MAYLIEPCSVTLISGMLCIIALGRIDDGILHAMVSKVVSIGFQIGTRVIIISALALLAGVYGRMDSGIMGSTSSV